MILKKEYLNTKAMNVLYYALSQSEFNWISIREITFDIWHTLKITHEDTSLLEHDFEHFMMMPKEFISDMFTQFSNIINGLKAFGNFFSNHSLSSKIPMSLPKN